jgi:hypothetical protein
MNENIKLNIENISNKPLIFKIKTKKTLNTSKPLNYIYSDTGKTRHFTPAVQEWSNSVYSYNNNYNKSLTVADEKMMSLFKSYLNSQFRRNFLKTKFRYLRKRFRRISTKKVFVGKGHVKHTSNKTLLTFFVYNTQSMFLYSFFKNMKIKLLQKNSNINNFFLKKKCYNINTYLNLSRHKNFYFFYLQKFINKLTTKLTTVNKNLINNKYIEANQALSINDKLTLFNNNVKEVLQNKNFNYILFYKYKLEKWKTYMKGYNKYKLLWKLNKVKYNNNFLLKLMYLAKKIYNKKVEFNIVNLKKLHLNSDIFTQAIVLKLKNRNNKLNRVLLRSLVKINLPPIIRVKEKVAKFNKNMVLTNKIRNTSINNMLINDSTLIKDSSYDPLSNLFLKFYPLIDNIKVELKKDKWVINNLDENNVKETRIISIIAYLHKYLKHMNIRGIRIEAKGRLTRRATASRSVFKLMWIGGLKNVDSSFAGLSTIMLRGFSKSNVQYTLKNSKTRNGAFGIKTWISSK